MPDKTIRENLTDSAIIIAAISGLAYFLGDAFFTGVWESMHVEYSPDISTQIIVANGAGMLLLAAILTATAAAIISLIIRVISKRSDIRGYMSGLPLILEIQSVLLLFLVVILAAIWMCRTFGRMRSVKELPEVLAISADVDNAERFQAGFRFVGRQDGFVILAGETDKSTVLINEDSLQSLEIGRRPKTPDK